MDELSRPKVYGDRLMPLIVKVDKELTEMDEVYGERADIFYREDDLSNIARLQNKLREIHNDLYTDAIRGDNAMQMIKHDLFGRDPFQDLVYRMMESEIFSEVSALFRFCEDY